MVAYLIEDLNQDVNLKDNVTAVIIAGKFDNLEVLEYLIDQGAEIQTVDDQGQNVLMAAAANDSYEFL